MAVDLRKARLHVWNEEEGRWFTQDDLAAAVGCSRVNITNIEAGKSKPSPDLAKRLADVLGIEWTEFFA